MNLNDKQKRSLTIATILAIVAIVWLFKPFFTVIVAAVIVAYIFIPVQNFLLKKLKNKGITTTITMLISILVLVIPLSLVIFISYEQVRTIADQLNLFLNSGTMAITNEGIIEKLNGFLATLTNGMVSVSAKQIQDLVVTVSQEVGQFLITFLAGIFTSLPRLITNLIIFLYVYYALLMHHNKLIKLIKNLNPLGDEVANIYFKKAGSMTGAMVRGQFIIAIVQGLLGALFLTIAGLNYFTLFALILTVLSIIPLGGGIVSIPIGIVMLLMGNIPGGLIVLLGHFVVVTNVDNVLKPLLVPKDVKFNAALLIVSVMSGLIMFGFIGLVVGPVLLAIALATIDTYIEIKAGNKKTKSSKTSAS